MQIRAISTYSSCRRSVGIDTSIDAGMGVGNDMGIGVGVGTGASGHDLPSHDIVSTWWLYVAMVLSGLPLNRAVCLQRRVHAKYGPQKMPTGEEDTRRVHHPTVPYITPNCGAGPKASRKGPWKSP